MSCERSAAIRQSGLGGVIMRAGTSGPRSITYGVNRIHTDFVMQKLDSDLVLVRKDPYLK
jgi:hypothetical protein